MLRAATKATNSAKILAVTVLTSFSDSDCETIYGNKVDTEVCKLIQSAYSVGVNGVVLSAKELKHTESLPKDFLRVTPGIRPDWAKKDEQKRTETPQRALELGASLLVVGRPIVEAEDKITSIKKLFSTHGR